MAYQQWNHHHHYQAIPESRPLLIQPWQHEFGCPIPRPRSFSLGSRPSGTDLMEVSTKRVFNPSAIILPVDSNNNYRFGSQKRSSKSRKCRWAIFFFMLAVSSLTILGWWKLRRPTNVVDLPKDNLPPPPLPPPAQQPYQQHQPTPQQSAYHPLPPPPAALVPPGTQQQQYYNQQPAWQPPPQQQYQQHAPPPPEAHYNYQQQQYNPHYAQQQHHAPHYGQQQYQHGAHVQQHSHKPDLGHHHQGEPVPRKSWMMEHADKPANSNQENDIRNQQHYSRQPQQQQQPKIEQQPQFQPNYQPHVQQPYVQPSQPYQQPHEHIQQPPYMQQQQQPEQPKVEAVLSRQEERAKARSQARTMNPIKNSTKTVDGDIWEENQNETVQSVESIIGIKLRLEPALFSYTESLLGSDGTMFITSFEDAEEVTIEIVEEA